MALDILRSRTGSSPCLAPVKRHYAPLFCFALLTVACTLASFAFACATPFAAFAVIAAAMLPLPSALLMVGAAWLVNQGIGFGMLHYPIDTNTILRGFAIGAAAIAATATAERLLHTLRRTAGPVDLAFALVAAYAAYELVLFASSLFLGGTGDFTVAIVGRLGVLSALWLIGLVVACEVFRLLNSALQHQASS
jgi:hypothetical protein